MFTGLVEAVGTVTEVREMVGARRLAISWLALPDDLAVGDSVSVDGACLTVVEVEKDRFSAEAIASTLARTVAGAYHAGSRVNLERAAALGDRLGGHLVQGHVDGLGVLLGVTQQGETRLLDFRLPPDIHQLTILHGSIAINGVSLTVNGLSERGCQVAVIPHTWQNTNLRNLRRGEAVNVEGDLIGKYVARLLGPWRQSSQVTSPASQPD
jgi:riboflavin synthase